MKDKAVFQDHIAIIDIFLFFYYVFTIHYSAKVFASYLVSV